MIAHRRSIILLSLLVLATLLPFVRRAYFVDDHYFVVIAKGLLAHPLHPYDFRADDEKLNAVGWERGQLPRMVNPPLFHYYLAMVIHFWGDKVWTLRSSMIPFSLLAVIAFYFVSLRFTAHAFYASCLFALTPAYWLTSYSLLIDSALVAWFLAALWAFMAGLEKKNSRLICLSGFLMSAVLLTKYSGALIIALAFIWQWMHASYRRWKPGYAPYFIVLIMMGLWSYWNIQTYGSSHLIASSLRGVKGHEPFLFYIYKGLALASFVGGGAFFVCFMPALLWKRSRFLSANMLLFAAMLTLIFSSPYGGFPFSQSVQLALWISVGCSFMVFLLLKGWMTSIPQRFLSVWFFLGVTELIVVMPWIAGRYLLILLPPIVLLFTEWLSDRPWSTWRIPILLVTALGAFCVALADTAQANVIFDLTKRLAGKECSHGGCYYLGDTFSAYPEYLGPYGWQASFPNQAYRLGDIIVSAHYRQSAWWRLSDTIVRKRVGTVVYPYALPLRVLDVPASAGWYASCWGALPFTITTDPLEQYEIDQVVAQ